MLLLGLARMLLEESCKRQLLEHFYESRAENWCIVNSKENDCCGNMILKYYLILEGGDNQ